MQQEVMVVVPNLMSEMLIDMEADEYVTTVGLYYALWDYCEWSDFEKNTSAGCLI